MFNKVALIIGYIIVIPPLILIAPILFIGYCVTEAIKKIFNYY